LTSGGRWPRNVQKLREFLEAHPAIIRLDRQLADAL
jgi:hypothetical protein